MGKNRLLKTLLALVLSTSFITSGAQSLYEIKFKSRDSSTLYTCFLVYNNENDCYMRVSYFNQKKLYRVVEITYRGKSGNYADGETFFLLTGESPRFIIQKDSSETYYPDYFLWVGKESLPYTTDINPSAGAKWDAYKVSSYKKLFPADLTPEYLNTFFGNKERDYISFLRMADDSKKKATLPVNNFATLHLVIMANTDIDGIGIGCSEDMKHLNIEFEDIAKTLNIPFKYYPVSGPDFDKANLQRTLGSLNPASDDIVVFIYRGHGFRWSDQKSTFPTLALTRSDGAVLNSDNSILLESVYSQIRAKGGRLNLVIADCCNASINRNESSLSNFMYQQATASADGTKLRDLFMNRKGSLLFTASEVGELSWTNGFFGGFFTTSFLQALSHETSYLTTDESSWINIITKTKTDAELKSRACPECTVQHAIYTNEITKR